MKRLPGAVPAHILQRITTLRLLDEALRECLPAECQAHCRAAGLSGHTLHLVTSSPAWRTRLRFHSTRIINHVGQLGNVTVTRVDIRVRRTIEAVRPLKKTGVPRTIPSHSARAFAALAEETEDAGLKGALQRLARHGRDE
ncbi:MAG: DUF721 domain-containing protein [Halofilum sp. (in: g-proteobacteria)]